MSATGTKMLEKYKARIKKQNDKIKEDYDRVTATLPKGTIDRIKAFGLTINGVINESVLAYLDCIEEEQETPEEPPKQIQVDPTPQPVEEVPRDLPKDEYKPTLQELMEMQKQLNAKKAEQDRKAEELQRQKEERERQEQEEREAEIKERLEKMRNGEEIEEDPELEMERQERIARANSYYS